jgi:hypothetical protein
MSDQWGIPGQQPNPEDPFGQPVQQQPVGDLSQQQPYGGAAGWQGQGPADQGAYGQNQAYPQPGYGYPVGPPPKQSNGLAVAGLVLAILFWPLGLIFSIIGLVRSKARGGAGKTPAIIGLVLAVLFGAGSIVFFVSVAKSTAADPGCISAESSISSLTPKLQADETKLNADSSNPAALQTDLTGFIDDMQSVQSDLTNAGSIATHSNVQTAIGTMDTDLGTFITDMKQIQGGDDSQVNQMTAVAQKLEPDGNAVDSLCSSI